MVSTDWSSSLHRQRPLAGPRTEGDPIGTGRRQQRPERVGFLRIAVVIGHANRTFLFDPNPPVRTPQRHLTVGVAVPADVG